MYVFYIVLKFVWVWTAMSVTIQQGVKCNMGWHTNS